jgi:hypothetical protein
MLTQGACLACGAEPGCNIDCQLCIVISAWNMPPSVAPDDTPPRIVLSQCCHAYMAGDERFCPKCGYECRIMDVPPVAPDDTPTRLQRERDQWLDAYIQGTQLPNGEYAHLLICSGDRSKPAGESGCVCAPRIKRLRAEVSRLQQEHADYQYSQEQHAKELTRHIAAFQEERAKLLEENALLRRSLEMLTKQLDEKDEEITDLRFTIIRHNSPA